MIFQEAIQDINIDSTNYYAGIMLSRALWIIVLTW